MEEAVVLQQQLKDMLDSSGIALQKSRPSSAEVLDTIPSHLCEAEPEQPILSLSKHHKPLGVHWNALADTSHVSVPRSSCSTPPASWFSDASQRGFGAVVYLRATAANFDIHMPGQVPLWCWDG